MKKFLTACALSALLATPCAAAPAWAEEAKEVAQMPEAPAKLYDESYVAYDAKFAESDGVTFIDTRKKYQRPEKDIAEMPKPLRFIELVVRTEGKEPVCRLNMVFDDDPRFAFPREDYADKTFPSAIDVGGNLRAFDGTSRENEIVKHLPVIEFGAINSNNAWVRRNGLRISHLERNTSRKLAFISGSILCSSLGAEEGKVLVAIQKASFKGNRDDYDRTPDKNAIFHEFYEVLYLPVQWLSKASPVLDGIDRPKREEQLRRNANNSLNHHEKVAKPAPTNDAKGKPTEAPIQHKDPHKDMFYDLHHIGYDAEFSKTYDLVKAGIPDQYVMEMPRPLRFIELVIRTEGANPACRLNLALDDDPSLAVPKEDYYLPEFPSYLSKALPILNETPPMASSKMPLMEIGEFDSSHVWGSHMAVHPTNLVRRDNLIFMSAPVPCVPLGDKPVLQIQLSKPTGAAEEINLPPQWVEQTHGFLEYISAYEKEKEAYRREVESRREK